MILVHYGSIFGGVSKDHFTLTLDNGKPSLYTGVARKLVSASDTNLADGQWHHLAVSMPKQSCLLSEVQIYVDGEVIRTNLDPRVDRNIFFTTSGRMSIGSFGYASTGYDDEFPNMVPYSGLLDDFKLFAKPLQSSDFELKRTFEISDGVRCNRNKAKKVKIRAQLKKCTKVCSKNSACYGFELRRTNSGKSRCFLFEGKPLAGTTARSRTKCGIIK